MGKLGGFGADVLVDEPPSVDHPLVKHPNVLITPHLAGTAAPASARSYSFAIENVARLARGEEMLCVVDPADFAVPETAGATDTAPAIAAEPTSGQQVTLPAESTGVVRSVRRLQKLREALPGQKS